MPLYPFVRSRGCTIPVNAYSGRISLPRFERGIAPTAFTHPFPVKRLLIALNDKGAYSGERANVSPETPREEICDGVKG